LKTNDGPINGLPVYWQVLSELPGTVAVEASRTTIGPETVALLLARIARAAGDGVLRKTKGAGDGGRTKHTTTFTTAAGG
jgi:hypothetical protein